MSRRFERYTEEQLEIRERRSQAAIEAEIRILKEITLELAARNSSRMEPVSAVPQGAADRQ